MPYLGSWKIDDYLTFVCNTHDPDTGVGTDADSVPTYRVYEDETGTAILTGSTAKLDDANTVGFYSERIQLTAANGFEKGKSYTIYITATVDSDAGTMSHTFQMEAEVDANSSVTSSDVTAIKAVTDVIPDSGALTTIAADAARLTAVRAAILTDWIDGGRLDALIDAIKAVTDVIPDSGALTTIAADTARLTAARAGALTDWINGGRLDLLLDALPAVTDITQRQIPDSVPADGTRPTIEQSLYMILQLLIERAVSGTTVTVKKVDGSTTLFTLTLDSATDPTSITRAT